MFLDRQGFAPFAEVIDQGMDVVDKIQSKYRERPNQGKVQHQGNTYLKKHFPDLSSVGTIDTTLPKAASVVVAAPMAQQPQTPQPQAASKPVHSLAETSSDASQEQTEKKQTNQEEVIR